MKKTVLAALLAASVAQAFATDYYVVIPAPGKAAARSTNIQVDLGTATLPSTPVGAAYSYSTISA